MLPTSPHKMTIHPKFFLILELPGTVNCILSIADWQHRLMPKEYPMPFALVLHLGVWITWHFGEYAVWTKCSCPVPPQLLPFHTQGKENHHCKMRKTERNSLQFSVAVLKVEACKVKTLFVIILKCSAFCWISTALPSHSYKTRVHQPASLKDSGGWGRDGYRCKTNNSQTNGGQSQWFIPRLAPSPSVSEPLIAHSLHPLMPSALFPDTHKIKTGAC